MSALHRPAVGSGLLTVMGSVFLVAVHDWPAACNGDKWNGCQWIVGLQRSTDNVNDDCGTLRPATETSKMRVIGGRAPSDVESGLFCSIFIGPLEGALTKPNDHIAGKTESTKVCYTSPFGNRRAIL